MQSCTTKTKKWGKLPVLYLLVQLGIFVTSLCCSNCCECILMHQFSLCYSGEGIPDLLLLLAQTQKTTVEKLTFRNEVQVFLSRTQYELGGCFMMIHVFLVRCCVTVYGIGGKCYRRHGTTIDVALVNGVLQENEITLQFCGFQGPIVTRIRALLTPHPVKGMRVKV